MPREATHRCPRICILTDSFYPVVGGGEAHARLLSDHLIDCGIPTFVLTQRKIRGSKPFERVGAIPVHRVWPEGRIRWGKYLMTAPALVRLFRLRRKYDVVYVCGLRVLGIVGRLASLLFGKRCILRAESCGEMSGLFVRSEPGGLVRAVIGLRNIILRRADAFVAISRVIREEYRGCRVADGRITSIPNGIDTAHFAPVGREEKERLRRVLGIPPGTVFIYTGKLNRGKGLELLLRVWKRVVDGRDGIHLLLVGGGGSQFLSCESGLRAYVDRERLGAHVTFTGYAEDVREYLQASDVFVFPSESEALGISLIEALSCGLPAIASGVGGILDIVKDGVNGRLVDARDEEGWYRGMIELLEDRDRARKLAKRGRETACGRFGIEAVTRAHVALFRRVLEDR